ncbi:transporter, outer membrane receptor (OMR) family [Hyphomonas neptunium ATCC 15444]|uniref:Transporter, outer membrane receptor (OMR) family n=2 Tax=Hyphomonas TaxID=85 RepID=Q0C037_HYPNA|nr:MULTISPECIES: TonB-dependent receptor [Hyphomonas]ABI75546.1 transporter, outer membrane receptor (OMR) family [Hyphomonas neptunium ATCC 15444]KCZ90511.1 outer membrane receptor (OMR) family protein [Hyphomonas hirschiana VP5]
MSDINKRIASGAGKFIRTTWLGHASALALLGGMALPAIAQETTPPPAAQEADTQEPATDELAVMSQVTVTAQRRAQSLGDVPISVNVVSGDTLAVQRISNLQDLSAFVPNLTVPERPGSTGASLRGLGTGGRNALFDQAVIVQVDGITSARSAQFTVPYFDVERVEVLRGAQGVLFGKNATAGAINIVTANPTDTFTGSVTAGYEFENQGYVMEGFVAGPLTETLGGRLAVKYERAGGFIEDRNLGEDAGEIDTIAARGTLQWRPNDRLNARFKIDVGEVDERGNNIEIAACTSNLARILSISPTEDCIMNRTSARSFMDEDNTRSAAFIANIDYEIGDHTFSSVSGYSQYEQSTARDLDVTPVEALNRYVDESYDQYYQEFRLISPADGRLTYILGVTGQFQNIELSDVTDLNVLGLPFGNLSPAPFSAASNRRSIQFADQSTASYSAFAHVTFNVTDSFRILGGARYTDETKEIDYVVTRALWGTNTPVVTPLDIDLTGQERSESNFDPQIGVQYDLTDRLMSYFTASIVHKGGGFNIDETDGRAIADTFTYQPEEAESYEAGLKWSGRGRYLNLAVFRTDFSDLQVASNDGTRTVVRNAAVARSEGVEVDGFWQLGDYITLAGGLAYTDATFLEYPGGSCTAAAAAAIAPTPCVADLSGNRLTFAPEWSGNLVADARFPVRDGLEATLGATLSYRSDQFAQENNDPTLAIDENTTVDLRAGLTTEDDRKSIRLVARNLFDETVPSFLFPFPRAPGSTVAISPRGRSVLLELSSKF